MARIRQSRPDSGLGLKVKLLKMLKGVPSSLESGPPMREAAPHNELRDGPAPEGYLVHKKALLLRNVQ
jgi:hypothetical protein